VDVSSAGQSVTFTIHVTAAAGFKFAEAVFRSPSGSVIVVNSFVLVSGTANDGAYQRTFVVPHGAEPGTWTLNYVTIFDNASNSKRYGSLGAAYPAGTPIDLAVANSNFSPPALVGANFTPRTVNVGSAAQSVTFTIHVAAAAGFKFAEAVFRSPSGSVIVVSSFMLTSGTENDGFYQRIFVVPEGAEPGTWTLNYITIFDNGSNSKRYGSLGSPYPTGTPTELIVTNSTFSPPALESADFTPKSADVSSAEQTVTFRIHVTAAAGFNFAEAVFRSPSGSVIVVNSFVLVSGTEHDGLYQRTFVMPQSAEPGVWTLSYVTIFDKGSNSKRYGSLGDPYPTGTPTALVIGNYPAPSIARSGTAIAVSILSFTGRVYQLQASNSPTASTFSNVGEPQDGLTGSTVTFTESGVIGSARFYRVLIAE
jgi:hypothetical protein